MIEMFNFKVFSDERKTLAVLSVDGEDVGCVMFNANDRFTSVIAKVHLDEDIARTSVIRHLHNERKVGAYSQDTVSFSY